MQLDIILLLSASITFAASALFPAMGEVLCEYSGVYNIGLEGIMLIATGTTVIGTIYTGNPYYGVLFSIGIGGIIGFLQAVFAVNLKADQAIWGIGLILLGPFLSALMVEHAYAGGLQLGVPRISALPTQNLIYPFNVLLNQNALVFLAFGLMAVTWFLIFKTQYGLAVRTTGENPHVAASAGFNVVRIRYVQSIIGCMVASIGGAFLVVGVTGEWTFNMTGGLGFLAIALVRLGLFRPFLIALTCLAYGFLNAFQLSLQAVTSVVPHQALLMIPYIMGIVALVISARYGRSAEPASLGKPYSREGT